MLDAFRAAPGAEPLLVVPTAADVDRYRRELAEDGGVLGVRVLRFAGLLARWRAAPAWRAAARARRARAGRRRRARPRAPGGAGRVRRHAGLPPGVPRSPRSSRSRASSRGAGPPRGAGRASRRAPPRRGARRLDGAYRDALARSAAATRLHNRGARRAARGAGALGRDAGAALRLRRPDALQLDAVETLAGHAARRRRLAHLRAGARGVRRPRRTFRSSPRSPPSTSSCRRAPSTTAPGAARARAHAVRAGRGPASPRRPSSCSRAAASAPSSSWSPRTSRGCSPSGTRRRGRRRGARAARAAPLLAAGVRHRGVPIALDARRRAHRARARARRPAALRAARRRAATCSPGCGRPASSRTPGWPTASSSARGGGPRPRRGAARWERPPGSPSESTRSRGAERPAGCAALAGAARCSPRRAAAGRACWPARGGRRARRRRAAPALRELEHRRPPTRAGAGARRARARAARLELRTPAAAPRAVTSRPARDPRATRARAVPVRPARGVFPRPATPEPFLGDDERRALDAAAGLRLRLHEDRLDAERFLFYAAVAADRAARALLAGGRRGGRAERALAVRRRRPRLLAARGRARAAPAAGGRRREAALAPTATEAARARGGARPGAPEPAPRRCASRSCSPRRPRATRGRPGARGLCGCPVKWFVERHLRPRRSSPTPSRWCAASCPPRARERAARAGRRPLAPERLAGARTLLRRALRRADAAALGQPERRRAALRRLEADLLRYSSTPRTARPSRRGVRAALRQRRGPLPPVELADGALRLRGGSTASTSSPTGAALVYDYKGKTAPPQAKWLEDARLQVGLYMLALPQLLGLEPAGGLYQPLGRDDDRRPRGVLLDDADPGLDIVAPTAWRRASSTSSCGGADAALQAVAACARAPGPARVVRVRRRLRHPGICRCEAASAVSRAFTPEQADAIERREGG